MKLLLITTIVTSGFLLSACLPEAPAPATTWYADTDGDGYGDENDAGTASTTQPADYVSNNLDCNDAAAAINPDSTETKDAVDENCDGVVDEGLYVVGDVGPAGGVVFYVNVDGTYRLEAAPVDQDGGSGAEWGCHNTIVDGADGTAIGTGAQNTIDILAEGCSAAVNLVNGYTLNGYSDWFLPSIEELDELFIHKDTVGGIVAGYYYWSSSESSADVAWRREEVYRLGGTKTLNLRVRAIRSF